ncbi:MAG: hypothetical protein OXP71_01650 [Candidatus Poribacteria bacterium]|nr:hypothetical protein [Candidatus Poribacteria bacterium]
MATVTDFVDELNNLNNKSPVLSDFNPRNTASSNSERGGNIGVHTEKKRYIFTQKYGWIDMKHFMAAAAVAADYRQKYMSKFHAYEHAYDLGYAVEVQQLLDGDPSGFSYEDLPSNDADASFGAYNYDRLAETYHKDLDPKYFHRNYTGIPFNLKKLRK